MIDHGCSYQNETNGHQFIFSPLWATGATIQPISHHPCMVKMGNAATGDRRGLEKNNGSILDLDPA